MTTTALLPPWAALLVGEDAVVVEVFSGGTSRATLLVEVPPRGRRLVVRHDGGSGPLSGSGFTLEREAAATRFALAAGVPAAEVIAVADDGLSVAVSEVPGDPAAARDALDDYLATLGHLHSAALDGLPSGFRGFDIDGRDDIAMWRELAVGSVPVLDMAFDLLERHGYTHPTDVAFCHGDAGAGNYLHDGDRVTGLVDWEMAHTGDPHDDIASVAVRAVLAGVELEDFVGRVDRNWAPVSGRSFAAGRYRLAVVAVLARMVASCHAALRNSDPTQDRSVQLLGLPLMEVHLLRVAARIEGVAVTDPDPDSVTADPAFMARMAELLAESGPAAAGAESVERRRARRIRYVAEQLVIALNEMAGDDPIRPSPPVASDIPSLWRDAQRRLAAVAASRPLAAIPIPGVN